MIKTPLKTFFPTHVICLVLISGLERLFSTPGFTSGKLRSQLGVEKAGKLAFLCRELNQ